VIFGIKEIKELTNAMMVYPNMDYTNYSLSFLNRRFSFVFNQLNIKRREQFLSQLSNADFRDRVITNMVVESTEMFRDPAFWRMFRDKLVDQLPDNTIIWLPNESSGEETYSVSVILHEKKISTSFKIICNNPSSEICNSINNGHLNGKHFDINQTNYRRLEENDSFDDYFRVENGHIVVNECLRENIKCEPGILSNTIPEGNISVIIFRNAAIYYNHKLTDAVFNILYEKLMPGGYLIIGVKEQLPESVAYKMTLLDEAEKIYRKPAATNNGF
jgi:chemotaxis protein methyltransferase CheR